MAFPAPATAARTAWYRHLYVQVLIGIALAVVVGNFFPDTGVNMKPLGDLFIKLIKMMIGLVVFCTIVSGVAGMGSMKKVGRVGGKALLYFEVVSTVALAMGMLVANIVQPGAGLNADPSKLDTRAVAAIRGRRQGAFRAVGLPGQHRPQHHLRRVRQGRHPAGRAGLPAGGLRRGGAGRAGAAGA